MSSAAPCAMSDEWVSRRSWLTHPGHEEHMMVPGKRRCMHCQTKGLCPDHGSLACTNNILTRRRYLQSHQKTLSFNIREAEVHAARIAVNIAIANDMFDLRINLRDEAIRECLDVTVVPLQMNSQYEIQTASPKTIQYPCTNITDKLTKNRHSPPSCNINRKCRIIKETECEVNSQPSPASQYVRLHQVLQRGMATAFHSAIHAPALHRSE